MVKIGEMMIFVNKRVIRSQRQTYLRFCFLGSDLFEEILKRSYLNFTG
jgi:hypothetical protein